MTLASDTSLVFNLVARDRASSVVSGMKDKISTAAAGIGAGLAAGMAAGFAANLEFGAASDKLAAQLGVGPKEAAELSKVSASVYSNAWGDSAETVNTAIRGVYQNIGDTSQAEGGLEGVSTKVLALAETFDQDLNIATAAAGQMMKTGLADNADEAMDIITAGFQSGVNKSDDFLETLNEYGTQFRDLGLSGEQATGILQQGLKGGARDADLVADSLKELNIRVKDGTAAEALGELGLNADQMADAFATGGPKATTALQTITDKLRGIKDPSDRAAMAQALLGTQSEDLSKALYSIDPSTAVDGLKKVKGAAENMTETVGDNPAHALEKFKRTAMMKLGEISGKLLTFGMENKDWLKPVIVGLTAFVGLIALAKAGMIIYNAYITITSGLTAMWTGIQWLMNTALFASPITWVVLAIIVLIGIIVLIATKTDWFQRLWSFAWGKIKGAALAVGRWFTGTLWPWIKGVWDKIAGGAIWAKNKIVSGFNAVIRFFSGLPGKIGRATSGMWNGIKSSFKGAVNWLIGRWNSFSLTIGGGSIMGVDIPSVTLNTPNIPYLAEGGNIARGGTAIVGEAGPEAINMPRGAQVTPLTRGGGTTRVVIDVQGADEDMKKMIRKMVRVDGRGDVQVAFGR